MISVDMLLLDLNVKGLFGRRNMTVKLRRREATIRGLIAKLDKECGSNVSEALSKPNILILVNGQDIEFLSGKDTGLSDRDRVAIVPIVAGG